MSISNPTRKERFGAEATIWVAYPSVLGYVIPLILACVFAGLALRHAPGVLQWLIDVTAGILPWTQTGAERALLVVRIVAFLPAIAIIYRMGILRLTRFELTNRRLRVCSGFFPRRHDEIALHRIRDYVVKRPILGLLWGYGSIRLISRDPTLPVLDMQWIPHALEKTQEIHEHALIWKERMGYREFDSGELS